MQNYIPKVMVFLLSFSLFVSALPVSASLLTDDGKKGVTENLVDTGDSAEFDTSGGTDGNFLISDVASTVVKAFLGLMGIIFLIMILIGGFNWMTAAGDSAKVDKAKATLVRGLIGLIIIVTAYIITAFVFRALGGLVGA